MDNSSYNLRVPKRWAHIALTAAVTALVVAPITALASHSFVDVPTSNTFHADIAWLADNAVTRGCNPPVNDRFCPDDNVTRGQMAAFMRRQAQTFGVTGDQRLDSVDLLGSLTPAELLSIAVTPKAEAEVVLNAHAGMTHTEDEVIVFLWIEEGSCTLTEQTQPLAFVSLFDVGPAGADALAMTGFDVVDSDTAYKLCTSGDGQPYTLHSRALTATWVPTG
jgi:hypothetical protein